ncbi:MAG: hypothetical protein M1836_004249 [Candelina mexicana]|nr:MAG: hypothetical protein M1836_004249 [Candelina mexicana]
MTSHSSCFEVHKEGLISGNDDLSDGKVQGLLHEAGHRLRCGKDHKAVKIRSIENTSGKDVHYVSARCPPKLEAGLLPRPYVFSKGDMARVDEHRLLDDQHRKLAGKPKRMRDPVSVRNLVQQGKKATAGEDWFNLPRTYLTPEFKRDLQLLRMRSVLDPKRNYKKDNRPLAPVYSQIGTIIEGPTEYYSGRLSNNERKKSLVDEVLAAEESSGRFKAKYKDAQAAKISGKKAYYKQLKSKRSAGGPQR